uniref:Phage protein D n=1 Tax=Candidatus Kentrum sp. LFY TaxID=2126342 RepID=A0A450WH27_9GAMM|nr:MAG: hypothetical protein BECKLFY1418C_GA0070996_102237 [Candidatus Kentron sp. LFY]
MTSIGIERPDFEITLNARNVTVDLAPYVLSLIYVDHVEGKADTLDIRLADEDGRFRGEWYPTKGDRLSLRFGYADEDLADGGDYEVDEVAGDGPPDTVTIRGIAAGVGLPLRTNRTGHHEDTTLAGIAKEIAGRLGLSVVGVIDPIPIGRETQRAEHDLTFLKRLAGEYGHAFSVKGRQLVFHKRGDLWRAAPVLTVARGDLSRYRITDKIRGVVTHARVSHHDPATKGVIGHTANETRRMGEDVSSDALELALRAETREQAMIKAESALDVANMDGTRIEATLMGNPRLVAGANFRLSGMGRFGGVWHITSSRHEMDRGRGYETEVEAKRVKVSV